MNFSIEPISFAVGVSAAATAAVVVAVRRLRRRVRGMRDDLRVAEARVLVSEAVLGGGPQGLTAAVPAVGLLAGAVSAVFPVAAPGQRTRMLVASPPQSADPSTRAAAALLAAVAVSAAEVPEFARALRSHTPQLGADLTALLRRGVTSLPFATRDKLFERLKRTPFVVVPITRSDGVSVVGLLLALVRREDVDRVTAELGRAATRLALLFPPPRKAPARAESNPRKARPGRPLAPRDAELILWLDGEGVVAACEPLQDDWTLEPPPRAVQDLFGTTAAAPLLERAYLEAPTAVGLARIQEHALAEVSLLRLADADGNTWGYAAFLRRVALTAKSAEISRESSESSRSASPLP